MNNQINIRDVAQLLNQAVSHHRAGETKEAEAKYNETLSFEREFQALLVSTHKDDQEQKILLRTIFSQAYNNIGIFREEENNLGQAISNFRHALDHAPGNVEAHTNLARVFFSRRNLENALASAREALKLNPKFIPAIIQLSRVCFALGQPGEAIEAIKFVAPALDKNARLNIEYGRLLEKSGDLLGARDRFNKAIDLNPDISLATLSLGGVNLKLGKYQKALDNYQTILEKNPENIPANTNIGFVLQRMGRYNEALNAYKVALSINPGHLETLSLYGSLLEMTGKYEEAIVISDQVLKTPKMEQRPFFTAQLTKAKCLRHMGQPQKELEALKILLDGPLSAPDKPRIYFEFGHAYDALGQSTEAMRYYKKANTSFLAQAGVFDEGKHQLPDFIESMQKNNLIPLFEGGYNMSSDDAAVPVFVTGFLMGGTKIIGSYLSSVPGLQVLEDSSMIVGFRREISRGKEYPACLKDLGSEEIRQWVAQYKTMINQFAPGDADRMMVNTYPLDFLELPLILKLFPKAKIIFVTMHPLDVVLNCYTKDFIANSANINFAELDSIASIYTSSLDLWQKYKKELSFDLCEVKAEALLAKPEKEMKKVLKFIDPENKTGALQALNAETLQDLSVEMSHHYPSGRWENYKKFLKDEKKSLGPVIKKLKY